MDTRFKNFLKRFDSKDTVDNILDFLEEKEKEKEEKEKKELNDLRNIYEGGYFIYSRTISVFGKEIEIWKINSIEYESKTIDWKNCYKIKSNAVSINPVSIQITENIERRLVAKEIKKLQRITEKDYNEIYEESKIIRDNLKNIISKYIK